MKARLASFYLDYLNDYLTIDRFAAFNLMSTEDAANLLALGRKYHEERTEPSTAELRYQALQSNQIA